MKMPILPVIPNSKAAENGTKKAVKPNVQVKVPNLQLDGKVNVSNAQGTNKINIPNLGQIPTLSEPQGSK